jgi:hypothetical protein
MREITPPPHFHAIYAEHEVFIEIATGKVLYRYIPGTALQLVRTWMQQHEAELRDLWDLATESAPFA